MASRPTSESAPAYLRAESSSTAMPYFWLALASSSAPSTMFLTPATMAAPEKAAPSAAPSTGRRPTAPTMPERLWLMREKAARVSSRAVMVMVVLALAIQPVP